MWEPWVQVDLVEGGELLPGEEGLLKTLTNESEYLGKKLSTNVDVPGNIHKLQFREFWEKELECSS